MTDFISKIHNSIHEIGTEIWDRLNGDSIFTSFAYLSALEDTKCVGDGTGWQVAHLSLSQNGEIVGLMPLYLKYHSQGEYIFDQSWAQAFNDAGRRYYPKLLCASPFTPVAGARLLAHDPKVKTALLAALIQICEVNHLSGAHINFPPADEIDLLSSQRFMTRYDVQYWWLNDNYQDFDNFLDAMTSSRRKVIRRERREITAQVSFDTLSGNEIKESHLDAFYGFISDTYERKWGRGIPYLTRAFFSQIAQSMADKIVLILGRQGNQYISGAINFLDDGVLYGRQWGCLVDIPFLHFETCYYQAIDFTIRNKLRKVEAGTQGEHKIPRGYRPHRTFSAHYIAHEGFGKAIADFLGRERRAMDELMPELYAKLPFKKG